MINLSLGLEDYKEQRSTVSKERARATRVIIDVVKLAIAVNLIIFLFFTKSAPQAKEVIEVPKGEKQQVDYSETPRVKSLQAALEEVAKSKFVGGAQRVTVTMYQSVPNQTDSTPDSTSVNWKLGPDDCAVSRNLFLRLDMSFGDYVYIEGYGVKRVADVMNSRYKNRVDIWVPKNYPKDKLVKDDGVLLVLLKK